MAQTKLKKLRGAERPRCH